MELTYSQLLNQLDHMTVGTGANYGLHNGKTGLCIGYFLLADKAEDKTECLHKARTLLDEISDNISGVEALHFSDGLTGIGWGIEWLVQNSYVDANTDEILEDLDDELYKTVVFARSHGISLSNGALGKAMYFHKRLMAQNPDPDRCRILCIKECMVLLIDELNTGLFNDESGLLSASKMETPSSLTPSTLVEAGQTLVFLAKIVSNRLNIEIIENMISSIITSIKKFHSGYKIGTHPETDAARHYLLHSWQIASLLLGDAHGYKEAITWSGQKYVLPGGEKEPPYPSGSIFEWLSGYNALYDSCNANWHEAWLLA
jgi:hypothetical protein